MLTGEIVGREEELASLRSFLGSGERGLRGLVLEGEAGIGKSTLWAAGVEMARECGHDALVSRPAEVELGLPHVVLADLLEDVVDELLPYLTPPRRQALQGALLLDRVPEHAVDPRALGVAIQTVSRRSPRTGR